MCKASLVPTGEQEVKGLSVEGKRRAKINFKNNFVGTYTFVPNIFLNDLFVH